jgi:hypothetical protein
VNTTNENRYNKLYVYSRNLTRDDVPVYVCWRPKCFPVDSGVYIQSRFVYRRCDIYGTPPNSEIICGQNVGTKVVCGMILFFEKKPMLKI